MGGSTHPGFDAYATSKQCNLATVLAFARETPRLRFNTVEPGFSPGTGLSRDANVFLRLLAKYVAAPLSPFIRYWSNLRGRCVSPRPDSRRNFLACHATRTPAISV